jgi:hypothetical protein
MLHLALESLVEPEASSSSKVREAADETATLSANNVD